MSTISIKHKHLLDTLRDFFARWGCRNGKGFTVFAEEIKVQVADRDDIYGNTITVSVDDVDCPYTIHIKRHLRDYESIARWAHARAQILRIRRHILLDIYAEIKIDAQWCQEIGEAANLACDIEQRLCLDA